MSNQTLRSLAKDYAKGLIQKDQYRKSRSELINGIVTGEISLKSIDYPPPLKPSNDHEAVTETNQRDRNKTEINTAPITTKKDAEIKQNKPVQNNLSQDNKKSPFIFITISAVCVILLITGVVLFYPQPPGSTTTEMTVSASKAAPAVTESNMVGETLIANFLSEKNWSETNIDQFITSWANLTQEERETASQTKRMQRMHDSIYKQFLEEKALSSIDSEKAAIKQQKLIKFAEAIGINDPRLVLN